MKVYITRDAGDSGIDYSLWLACPVWDRATRTWRIQGWQEGEPRARQLIENHNFEWLFPGVELSPGEVRQVEVKAR